jgi:hypothetical protein
LFKASFRNGYKIFLIEQAGLRAPSVGVDHRLGVVLEGIDAGAPQNRWINDQVTEDEWISQYPETRFNYMKNIFTCFLLLRYLWRASKSRQWLIRPRKRKKQHHIDKPVSSHWNQKGENRN